MRCSPERDRLLLREESRRDLVSRTFQVRAETVDLQTRSVEATIATENPVEVYDWRRDEIVREVLLMDGAELAGQIVLLANHNRWSLDGVLGSIRQLRVEGDRLVGRLYFAEAAAEAERAWNMVRQGHLRDVSVGYRIGEAVEIPAGQTAALRGRQFNAGNRGLRVVTAWTPREGSLVPIGADAAAKIRQDLHSPRDQEPNMNPQLRAFLESLGLRREASEAEAKAFYAALSPADRARADAAAAESPEGGQRSDDGSQGARGPDGGRREGGATPPSLPGQAARQSAATEPARGDGQVQIPDPEMIAREAIAAERRRVQGLTALAGEDVPADLLRQAIDEGWDEARASREFLGAVRAERTQAVGPAIHSRSREADTTVRSLAANLALNHCGMVAERVINRPLTNGIGPIDRGRCIREQDIEAAVRLGALSAMDLVRLCAQADRGRWIMEPSEALRTAVSGGTLAYVFTTSLYARLLQGWETIGDTTIGWCDEEDVANFLTQEDISLSAASRLEELPRGDTAKHASLSDKRESYKIARYAKQFVVDEQDIIDDRLGAILRMPFEMGEAARRLRPDLVYSLLLENPSMTDGGAVFNATAVTSAGGHANLSTTALGSAGLKAAISAMVKQRLNRTTKNPGEQLNIRPRFLIVPAALEWEARALTASAALAKLFADSSDPWYSQLNLLAQEGLRTVVDDRIGAIGVFDPRAKVTRTGTDTNYFLTQGSSRGLRVAYLRGTGRAPAMRSFILDRGQYGLGWDVKLDIGAAFTEWMTWHKSTGASS